MRLLEIVEIIFWKVCIFFLTILLLSRSVEVFFFRIICIFSALAYLKTGLCGHSLKCNSIPKLQIFENSEIPWACQLSWISTDFTLNQYWISTENTRFCKIPESVLISTEITMNQYWIAMKFPESVLNCPEITLNQYWFALKLPWISMILV